METKDITLEVISLVSEIKHDLAEIERSAKEYAEKYDPEGKTADYYIYQAGALSQLVKALIGKIERLPN